MSLRRLIMAGLVFAANPVLAQEADILLVRKMENCAALLSVISDNAKRDGNADMSARASESAGQYKMAAEYYAAGFSASGVDKNVATAKEKIEYLYKHGGDEALRDDIDMCGSEEMAEKGQAALNARKEADEAANKGK